MINNGIIIKLQRCHGESIEEFFASYRKAQEEVDKEDEEEMTDENLKKMGEDEFINKFLKEDKNEEVKNKEEVKKEIKKKLKEVLDVIDKQRSKVGDILRVLDEGKDPEDTSLKLTPICLIHSAVMKKEEVSGEWMYSKIDQIKILQRRQSLV